MTPNKEDDLNQERLRLREVNTLAWESTSQSVKFGPLDSSLKKNMAFIKKARVALTWENLASFKTDIATLSLEKYLSEVVSAVVEGLGKLRVGQDLHAATEVVSVLHQRFGSQFTLPLAFQLIRSMAPSQNAYLAGLSTEQRDKEESNRISKQKMLIKVITELWLVNVTRSLQDAIEGSGSDSKKKRSDEALPVFCLRELLSSDGDFVNLPIATSFARSFSWLLHRNEGSENFCKCDESNTFNSILQKYFNLLETHLSRQAKSLAREAGRLEEFLLSAPPNSAAGRENKFSELQKVQDKQVASLQILADALNLKMPELRTDEDSFTKDTSIIRGIGGGRVNDEGQPSDSWEDDDQRRFYEILVDLSAVVPSDMLSEERQPSANQAPDEQENEFNYDDLDLDNVPPEVEEEIEQPTSIGAKVDSLLIRLPEMNNRELIDKAAVEFAFLNSKASRNRLVKTLLNVPTGRIDILPYYARLVAILNQNLHSIGEALCTNLHRDCRRYVRAKGLNKDLPLRTLNIRYLAELIKFGVVPSHIALHCLKILLDGFTKPDIEVVAVMLEHCGRFMLRHESSSARMQALLDILMRKIKNVSGVERTLVENAFYYVNPPEQSNIQQTVVVPICAYIEKLIYADLSKKTYDRVLRQLKKMDWRDPLTRTHLLGTFTKVWKVKFSSIYLIAILLSGLSRLHVDFVTQVIDTVMEDIRRGLEENRFRDNQERIASMKFVGEMLNYKLLDVTLTLDILYLLLSYGHSNGRPTSTGCQLDPRDDFFRIWLVVTLLDTCGPCFEQGSLRTRLDLYLCFFQYYLKTKAALPLEVDFATRDTLSRLRPGLKYCDSMEEAAMLLDEAVKASALAPIEQIESDDDSDSSESPIDLVHADDEESPDIDASVLDDYSSEKDDNADEEQQFVLLEKKRVQDDLDRVAEDDLEREFGKLMSESLESRKQESKRPLDLMLSRKQLAHITGTTSSLGTQNSQAHALHEKIGAVPFTFLSKKGKPKQLNLPSTSAMVVSNTAQRLAEEMEKKHIRDLTLKYEVAQSREDLDDTASKHGIHVRYAQPSATQRGGSMFRMGAYKPKE